MKMPIPEIKTKVPGEKSQQYAERLRNCESIGLTYLSSDFPVFWERAKGTNVWDVDGNRFLDLNSSFGVASLGHANERVIDAINKQTEKIIHGMGDVHPPSVKVEFLEQLLTIMPQELNACILSVNGSDACESALKSMQVYTGKPGVIAFEYGYHGLGYGSLDVTHKKHFRQNFTQRLTEHTHFVNYPNSEEAMHESLQRIKKLFELYGKKIGGIIIEPVQGRGGVVKPPKGFLKELREICNLNGALLILDEIYTGFCRTGSMFAFQKEEIVPDLLCLGKTLGGGVPLSVCVGRKEIMDAWGESNGEAIHTSTFLGNPLSCAAGLAVLSELKENDFSKIVQEKGQYFLQKLRNLRSPLVKEVRGEGLMLGIEFVDLESETAGQIVDGFMRACLAKGLIVLNCGPRGNVISLSPPFVITHEEIDYAVSVFEKVLASKNNLVAV
jgi:4-aminobutyrate aminotransferase-like enzyme